MYNFCGVAASLSPAGPAIHGSTPRRFCHSAMVAQGVLVVHHLRLTTGYRLEIEKLEPCLGLPTRYCVVPMGAPLAVSWLRSGTSPWGLYALVDESKRIQVCSDLEAKM